MTAQIAEKLLYQGQRVAMLTNPLSGYIAMGGFIPCSNVALEVLFDIKRDAEDAAL